METLEQINCSSNITHYKAKDSQTVQEMLKRLNLETYHFAILVNGKKVTTLDHPIKKNDSIVVLPKIA